ncbi:MAG: hypothetical protein J7L71_04800 [Spirochaetaceae bacterium]|nr:hypothetical protein [Spirochaetaceae bacterium]
MKNKALIIILSLLTTFSFGLDFGGNLEDSTIYYNSDSSEFYHADTLALWLTTGLWTDTNLYVQGSYTYTSDDPYFFDIDYLKIENKSVLPLNYTIGRFSTSDSSKYIFSHKMDGVSLVYNLPSVVISAKAGYTGLLFNSSSNIEMTLADQTGTSYSGIDQTFASPRIVGGLQAFFPELYLKQDFKADLWMQMDMRPDSDLTAGGKLDTQYFGVTLSGPIVPALYYDSFAYLGTGKSNSGIAESYSVLSFLGSAGLRYYMENFLFSRISFRFLYSSGDSDSKSSFLEGNASGNSNNFTPISGKTLSLIFSPTLGNIFLTQLSYSLKPFSNSKNKTLGNIQFELTNINFFRSTTGLISESGINSASNALYLGTEIDGTVNYRPFSDLGVSLSTGVFIPNNGSDGAFNNTKKVEYLGRLGISFSF